MEKSTNYSIHCPSKSDYVNVLQGRASYSLSLDFYKHLDECELCSISFEGYRINNATPVNMLNRDEAKIIRKNPLRLLAYAATIAIMVGGYFFFQNVANNNSSIEPLFVSDAYTDFEETATGSKKLMAKNQEDYWHVNADGVLSLNDQVISEEQIDEVKLEEGRKAFVEVGSADNDIIEPLVQKLKEEKNQKVFTLSKKRNLNPIHSL